MNEISTFFEKKRKTFGKKNKNENPDHFLEFTLNVPVKTFRVLLFNMNDNGAFMVIPEI